MDAVTLNTIGLALDIAGVVLLFKFGLPNHVFKSGGSTVVFPMGEAKTEAGKREWKRYRFWSYFALGLLVTGFALQIASNHYDWLLGLISTTD